MRVLLRGELARYAKKGASEVTHFESEVARFIGVNHALGVNSGTSALICALVGAGIGPGDEVLVPAYTWVASAAAPLSVGAVPVLVEVDRSLTIDPVDIRRKITPRTKAIMPVHMLNLPCDMDAIMEIAREHDLVVVEDACQAMGVRYRGKRLGSIGHVGAFSFQQHKAIHAGEGGAIVTNDARIYARATMHHDVGSYIRLSRLETDEPLFPGMNFRMPELSAALLRPQLRRLDRILERRRIERRMIVDRIGPGSRADLQPSPHHDPETASGLTFEFEGPEEALAFAKSLPKVSGASRLIDTGRHVYTNWESVLARRSAHPKLDPYAWAPDAVKITKDSCPRTLEILARTCHVQLLPEISPILYRAIVELTARRLGARREVEQEKTEQPSTTPGPYAGNAE